MAIRQLNIKGRTYYFYNDLISIKNFKNNLKLDKKVVWGDIMQKYQEVFNGTKEIIKKINDYNQPII